MLRTAIQLKNAPICNSGIRSADRAIPYASGPHALQNEICAALCRPRCATKRKILVADDEPIIANTLVLILEQFGFEARAVHSGEAAVEAIGSFQPDVLISDVVMPGMGGIQAAIVIRSQMPKCRIFLFSGQAASCDLLRDASAQGTSFEIMSKPVHPSDLLARLHASGNSE